ncbi:MAG: glycine cleavage system protein GcvH [Chlamydiales bacterium]|nr:glycine cleavage system protein GcvH [Chlamydiales bacterium]
MKYTESHEWVELEGEIATVGISDYAQKELGGIVYVELPVEGHPVKAGDEAVVLESTKAAVDIYTPVGGEISAVNTSLREYPEKVNNTPQTEGWLFKVKVNNHAEIDSLMDEKAYQKYIKNI